MHAHPSSVLKSWGALYHDLLLGKPEGDIYIDDKGFNCNQWIFPDKQNNLTKNINRENFVFKEIILEHFEVLNKLISDEDFIDQLYKICEEIKTTFDSNGKLILAGNGGSFADSQHIAAEFVCKFRNNRRPLPAISLGTNSSNLTAIGNDFGFEDIFSREFIAIANKSDLLIAITTSGNSENIIRLIFEAESKGIPFFILSGHNGGKLNKYKNKIIKVPSKNTAIIQQIHILLGHIICMNTESKYL